jgi:4-hydroxy-3-methylbut-2-enyl diphosphate reductase
VRGKVISIVNGEVMVDLQYKSDGVIQRGHFSDVSDIDPATVVSPGDEIEVHVLRVNDGDGNVLLSKKKVDAQKGFKDIEDAHKNGDPVKGKIVDIVKGGAIASVSGVRVFVPATQISNRFVKDLKTMLGEEHNFNIIDLDKNKRPWRIIAGRRDLATREAQERKDKAIARLTEGEKFTGTVSNIAAFGAFVDLDGIDGLVHITELSWGRVRNVSDVLKEGDTVEVYVLRVDREKGKVSLTLKDIKDDPWNDVEENFPLGSIVEGKVVRLVDFGAFVELKEGLMVLCISLK